MRHHTRPPRARTAPSPHSTARPRLRAERSHEAPDGSVLQSLVVEVRHGRGRPLITVSGELDVTSAGLLTAMIDHVGRGRHGAPAGRRVDVDLSGVTFADSHGLAPVLDGSARIVAASATVRRVRRLLQELPDASPHRVA